MHMTHLGVTSGKLDQEHFLAAVSCSPGVSGTCGHQVLLVTVAAWVINWAPRVGQVIRRIGDTHLTQGTH